MAELIFRVMDKSDLDHVVLIEQDCQSHPWSMLQFQEGFNAGHQGWVATKVYDGNEIIAGFAIMSSVLDESSLLKICISQAFQRQGIGQQLLDVVIQEAVGNQAVRIFLEVRVSNQAAITLYEKKGFTRIGRRREYYSTRTGREDGLVYSLSLASEGEDGDESCLTS